MNTYDKQQIEQELLFISNREESKDVSISKDNNK
jgi:hypothetical protein